MITCTFEDGGTGSLRHVVVDSFVIKNGEILLVKRARGKLLEGGKWGLVGGYVDRDETTAEAVAREVMEETGWRVTDIKLLWINDRPDRPHEDRQNVALVYVCTATEKTGEPDEQRWFTFDELPPEDQIAFDHADNLKRYREQSKSQ